MHAMTGFIFGAASVLWLNKLVGPAPDYVPWLFLVYTGIVLACVVYRAVAAAPHENET